MAPRRSLPRSIDQVRLPTRRNHRLDIFVQRQQPPHLAVELREGDLLLHLVQLGLFAEARLQLMPLLQSVQRLDALLQRDRNQQADRDRPQMDEKVPPGVGSLVGRVDVEHLGFLRFSASEHDRRGYTTTQEESPE